MSDILKLLEENALLKAERVHDINQIGGLQEENTRLQAELKFAEHRMIALAEALADTRIGYQKEIEILQKSRSNPKRDQGSHKKDNQGKPSRPGRKGESIGDKPRESGGTY